MQQVKIDSIISFLGDKIPSEKMYELHESLKNVPDDKYMLLMSISLKDPTLITVLSVVLGELGIDRFMLGEIGLGLLKLFTFGGCGVWWFIDLFIVGKKVKEKNYQEVMKRIAQF